MVRRVNLILFLFVTFSVGIKLYSKESKSCEYGKYVNEIVDDFVKEMKKKYHLHCCGSGGSMPSDVEKINVLFISYSKLSIDDARKLEVGAIQGLLHRINTHEKIRPYLREYPFHSGRIGVSISFRTQTDGRPLDGSVAYVSIGGDKIFYYAAEMKMSASFPLTRVNENNEWTKEIIEGELEETLVPLMDEPYEEAVKIVGAAPRLNQKS